SSTTLHFSLFISHFAFPSAALRPQRSPPRLSLCSMPYTPRRRASTLQRRPESSYLQLYPTCSCLIVPNRVIFAPQIPKISGGGWWPSSNPDQSHAKTQRFPHQNVRKRCHSSIQMREKVVIPARSAPAGTPQLQPFNTWPPILHPRKQRKS